MPHSIRFSVCQDKSTARRGTGKLMNFCLPCFTETATDDPSKSVKRAKRGNAGKMALVYSTTIFLELFSSTWVKELTQHCEVTWVCVCVCLCSCAQVREKSVQPEGAESLAGGQSHLKKGKCFTSSCKYMLCVYTLVLSLHFLFNVLFSFFFWLQWWRKCSRVSSCGASLTEGQNCSSRKDKAGPQHPHQPRGQSIIEVQLWTVNGQILL